MRIPLLIFSMLVSCLAVAQQGVAIARRYSGSVVTVLTEDGNHQSLALGSGFVVENGRVVTNYHVIEGARFATVVTSTGAKHEVNGTIGVSAANDLAILSVPGLSGTVTLSSDSVQIGERVYAIGSPEGLTNSLSEGIVSGVRVVNQQSLIQVTAPISAGSSGGPMINERGEVIGVAVGAITSGQNLNFAIPVRQLNTLLASAREIRPLNQLPVKKSITAGSVREAPVNEVLMVTDMDYDAFEYATGVNSITGHYLKGISLRNNSSRSIGRVKLLFILYNAAGQPIDNLSVVLCSSGQREPMESWKTCDAIPRGLAKYYSLSSLRNGNEEPRVFERRSREKLEVRILDFELLDP